MAKARQQPVLTKDYIHFDDNHVTQGTFWAPVWCATHHFENLKRGSIWACGCPPGPQVRMLQCPAFEIGSGGARGGLKTEGGRGKAIGGNQPFNMPIEHTREQCADQMRTRGYCGWCVNTSYIKHPRYRCLILRENEKDLADYLLRARLLFGPMGAEITEKPARVRWPTGAEFQFGHMRDATAFTDYQGQEFHRMIFEELTQIKSEELYVSIILSCRSTFKCFCGQQPEQCHCGVLQEQVLSTFNPGGPGGFWVKERFIDQMPPNTIYVDPVSRKTRVFIPSFVTDNPYLMQDDGYINQLEMLRTVNPAKYRAWRFGDWNALSGGYFPMFRPNGPLGDTEPAHARHVITPEELRPEAWYPRVAACDWGWNHAAVVLGAFETPERQTVMHKELAVHETDSKTLGCLIARMFAEDLAALHSSGNDPVIVLFLSPDAWGKRDAPDPTANLIVAGIQETLGRDFGHLWEDLQPPDRDPQGFDWARIANFQARRGIIVRQALNQRIDGWQHVREMLRFEPLKMSATSVFDPEVAIRMLHEDPARYSGYVRAHQQAKSDEKLPKLLIYNTCKGLIRAIPAAVHEEGTEDLLKTEHISDDFVDALRYLLHSRSKTQNREPRQAFVKRHQQQYGGQVADFNDLVWMARTAEAQYAAQDDNMKPFTLHPASSPRSWVQ